MRTPERVRADFDAMAAVLRREWAPEMLSPCESRLLELLPERCDRVLDVGCGDGRLTRQLARRAGAVLALDLSPEMIRLARDRSAGHRNIEYRLADVRATPLPPGAFDAVVTVATLHHLPLSETVGVLKAALRPGGMLVVQDVVDRSAARYALLNGAALLLRMARSALGTGPGTSRTVARLYRHHGKGEKYLRPSEVEQAYAPLLPGARVIQHLEWRYTVVWTAPMPGE